MSPALDELLAQAHATAGRGETRWRAHRLAQWLCLGRHTLTGLLSTAGRTGSSPSWAPAATPGVLLTHLAGALVAGSLPASAATPNPLRKAAITRSGKC